MALDILRYLETGKNLRGAVILTYTLNLNFFEQLVAPRLEQMGCTNVLILADRHGYDDALTNAARGVNGAGSRYVCAPLLNPGAGVQHAKAILLVGPETGRLLIGSGNLSFYGYCRNLELCNVFEVTIKGERPDSEAALYPFTVIWQLLQQLRQTGNLSAAAIERLDALQEIAPWLTLSAKRPEGMQFWHTLEHSIYSRLAQAPAVDELHIIAPFIEVNTVTALLKRLHPQRLVVGVDALSPNLDGANLAQQCRDVGSTLELRALGGATQARMLHAKAIIGVGAQDVWCLSGSANCTPPAMLNAWYGGGNLEFMVWQQASTPDTFLALWEDAEVSVNSCDPTLVHPIPRKSSDGDPDAPLYPVRLLDLRYEDGHLQGRYEPRAIPPETTAWALEFLRKQQLIPFSGCPANPFVLNLSGDIGSSEAARIVLQAGDKIVGHSPYHWIDQPAALARYGQRSYYGRIREGLRTFDGAGKLFEELLNFLWERVDPRAIQQQAEEEPTISRSIRRKHPQGSDSETPEPPPPADFITDEVVSLTLGGWAGGYAPYDRSTLSLRDLLSLVLLKLTTETEPVIPDTDERDEDEEALRQAKQEAQRNDVLKQLRTYLMRYCRRYAQRLLDVAFVRQVGPALLFENHYTLGRILLEFADKVDSMIFSDKDFRECVLLLLGGLFWPRAAGLEGPAAWQSLIESGCALTELQTLWDQRQLSALLVLLVTEAWGRVPHWHQLLGDEAQIQVYMLAQALIQHSESALSPRFWETLRETSLDTQAVWGFRRLGDLSGTDTPTADFASMLQHFVQLAEYRTPVEEKYADLFAWWELRQRYRDQAPEGQALFAQIQHAGYGDELNILKTLSPDADILPLVGDTEYCPHCSIALTSQVLWRVRRGDLALCSQCRRVALYWQPKLAV